MPDLDPRARFDPHARLDRSGPRAGRRLALVSQLAASVSLLVALFGCAPKAAPDLPALAAPVALALPAPELELPESLRIPDPEPRVRLMREVELLSESVAGSLHGLAEKLRVRDFEGAAAFLSEDFEGHDLFERRASDLTSLRADAVLRVHAPPLRQVLDRAAFRYSMGTRLGPWRRVEHCQLKVKGAEFEAGPPVVSGKVRLAVKIIGQTQGLGRESITAVAWARVVRSAGSWRIERLVIERLESLESQRVLFRDVTRSAGVAHAGIPYGEPGNDSDAWNGAAVGDVDGDGLYDIFVPSSERNYLYVNREDGTFLEQALPRGLSRPAGGTGAVFFDYDNDGDQDLAVAHVAHRLADRSLAGSSLRLYANDGQGRFRDVSAKLGFDLVRVGFSWTAFDYDGDGWVDLFLCGYGRMEHEANDNWIEATNGSSNTLLRNLRGEHFVDVTQAAGLDDRRWSYGASAADYDRDGDIDLYVANNFGSNRLYRNAGDGSFEDVAAELGVAERGNSMGAGWGDFDNDGRLDLYVTNPASAVGERILGRLRDEVKEERLDELFRMAAGNSFFAATETGALRRLNAAGGAANAGWVWGSALGDFDLDGALDIYCANGFFTGELPEDT